MLSRAKSSRSASLLASVASDCLSKLVFLPFYPLLVLYLLSDFLTADPGLDGFSIEPVDLPWDSACLDYAAFFFQLVPVYADRGATLPLVDPPFLSKVLSLSVRPASLSAANERISIWSSPDCTTSPSVSMNDFPLAPGSAYVLLWRSVLDFLEPDDAARPVAVSCLAV